MPKFQSPVRTIRLLQQRSQEAVAAPLGRSGSWLGLIERGRHIPPRPMQERLAAELQVSRAMIFPEQSEGSDER